MKATLRRRGRGRPRGFDRDQALRSALLLFRENGYEGTTLADLQEVMGGITPPSFYAAFESKEVLFREAVELYRREIGASNAAALDGDGPARAAIEAMLRAAVESFTKTKEPRGCLLVLGAISCSQANKGIEEHMRELRQKTLQAIARRIKRGVTEGDVPDHADVNGLASFYATVLHGISIQARDGVSRASLMKAVDHAMASWR